MSTFCSKCGTALNGNEPFCPNCGTPTGAPNMNGGYQNPGYQNPGYQNAAPQPMAAPYGYVNMESKWDGGVLETVAASIVASLIMGLTCGIATPWAVCYIWKFIISHTMIDGRRLTFDGNGGQLFGNWIKWFLLTVITCGIYSFWVVPRMYNWIAKHTHLQ